MGAEERPGKGILLKPGEVLEADIITTTGFNLSVLGEFSCAFDFFDTVRHPAGRAE